MAADGAGRRARRVDEDRRIARHPLAVGEFPGLDGFVTANGDLRTLPYQWPNPDPRLAGLDGFYAARLQRL